MIKQHERFTYSDIAGKLTRLDFDRPVILYEVQVGNHLVAVHSQDPVIVHCPELQIDIIANEERSRFTPNKPYAVKTGHRVMTRTDRPCRVHMVIEGKQIEAEYESTSNR